MNRDRDSERTAREAVARAERALERAPEDRSAIADLARAWLQLGEILQTEGRSFRAQDAYRFGLRNAERLVQAENRDDHVDLFVDALMHAASVAHAVYEESATTSGSESIPDSLPPDPDEASALWLRAIELLERRRQRVNDDPEILQRLAMCHGQLAFSLDHGQRSDESFGHYRASLAYSERVAAARPTDHKARSTLALAHNAIGHHYGEGEQIVDAIDHHLNSLELNQKLLDAEPTEPYWLYCLATDHENLCDAYARRGNRELALEHATESVRLRKLLCESSEVPTEWLSQLADSYRDVADISQELGDEVRAVQNLQASLGVLLEVVAREPDVLENSFRVADCLTVLGFTDEAAREFDRAYERHLEALAIYDELGRRDPEEPSWFANAAYAHLNAAVARIHKGDRDASDEHVARGLEILGEQLERHPGHAGLLGDLSHFHTDIGHALSGRDELDAAIAHYRHALAVDERLTSEQSGEIGILADLAVTLDSLAGLEERAGNLESSVDYSRRSVAIERQLCDVDPESTDYQGRLAHARIHLAHALRESGSPLEAIGELERAEKTLRRLARLVPDDDSVIGLFAQVGHGMGLARRDSGDPESAETAFSEAIRRLDTIAEKVRVDGRVLDVSPLLAQAAECRESRALLLLDAGRAADALEDLHRVLGDRKSLSERYPEDLLTNRDLARTHETIADAFEALSDFEQSREHRAQATRLFERFGDDH